MASLGADLCGASVLVALFLVGVLAGLWMNRPRR
jgi:hypothetical protein